MAKWAVKKIWDRCEGKHGIGAIKVEPALHDQRGTWGRRLTNKTTILSTVIIPPRSPRYTVETKRVGYDLESMSEVVPNEIFATSYGGYHDSFSFGHR